jgi:hypothetical protein
MFYPYCCDYISYNLGINDLPERGGGVTADDSAVNTKIGA